MFPVNRNKKNNFIRRGELRLWEFQIWWPEGGGHWPASQLQQMFYCETVRVTPYSSGVNNPYIYI